MLVRYSYPVFASDLSTHSRVKKVGHHRPSGESLIELLERFHFHETHAAISQGMVVPIAMRFLDDYLILQAIHLRWYIENGSIGAKGNASRRPHRKRRGSACSNQRSLATKPFRQILTGG